MTYLLHSAATVVVGFAAITAAACLAGRALKRAAATQTVPLDAGPLLGRDTASRRAARRGGL